MFKVMHDNDNYDCEVNIASLFSPPSALSTPSTRVVEDDSGLYRARLILENQLYDELLRRYRLAVTRLGELGQEARSLQEENEWLRLAYEDLNCTLDGLLVSSDPPPPLFYGGGGSNRQLIGMSSTNNNNNINNNNNNDNVAAVIGSNSPTSVITNQEERILLPKSISVPSPGYFKLKKSSPSSTPTTPMTSSNLSTPSSQDVNGIRLRVRRDVDKAIELDVYNQGMYKTELCNKWQQTNTCPYRDHCRFAHGLSELRPVIRHPRYKTQVCRMVLSGTMCPYGHRCHFRHHST